MPTSTPTPTRTPTSTPTPTRTPTSTGSTSTPTPTRTPTSTALRYEIPWVNISQAAGDNASGFNLTWSTGSTGFYSDGRRLDINYWVVEVSEDFGATWGGVMGGSINKGNLGPNQWVSTKVLGNPQFNNQSTYFFRVSGVLSSLAPQGMVSVPKVIGVGYNNGIPTPTRTVGVTETPRPTNTVTGTPYPTPMPTATYSTDTPAKVYGLYIGISYVVGPALNGIGVALLQYKAYWSPLNLGKYPLRHYVIQKSVNNGVTWFDYKQTQWLSSGVTVDNGEQIAVSYRICGENQIGRGPWSDVYGWGSGSAVPPTARPTSTAFSLTPGPTRTPRSTSTPNTTPSRSATPITTHTPNPTPQPTRTLMPTRAPNATVRPTSTPASTLRPTSTPYPTPLPTRTPLKKYNQAVFIDSSGKVTKQSVTPGQSLQFKSSIVLGYAESPPSGVDCWVCSTNGPVNIGPISSEKCLSLAGRSLTSQDLDCCQGSTYQVGTWSPSSKSCDLACRSIDEICADSTNCSALRCDESICGWAIDACDGSGCYDNCQGAWCGGSGCAQGTYADYNNAFPSAIHAPGFNARYICDGNTAFTLQCPGTTPTPPPSATSTPSPSPTPTNLSSSSSSSPYYPKMMRSDAMSITW